MADRTCSVNDCENDARTKGLCPTHYTRLRVHGDVQAHKPIRKYLGTGKRSPSLDERFWLKVDSSDPLGCWPWVGSLDVSSGYGRFQVDGRAEYAHRISHELSIGPIPRELEIDHLCRNRCCVNPLHLEAVTQSENQRRRPDRKVTHCPQDHPYSGDNLYEHGGRRYCKACMRAANARSRRKRAA